ncbi:MAG: hypothetical protein P4L63_01185 [Candidatus Pacebacteria bacterium]|nr:hypothetical protein [Candidatus Paceibacterota bacterium]
MPSQDLRTKKTYDKYMRMRANGLLDHGCRLCQIKPIKKFKYWKIINNEYPWDLIAKINHILVSKRHTTYEKLNQAERKEFDFIKASYLEKNYGHMVETTNKRKSIPDHFHIHLLVLKNKFNIK